MKEPSPRELLELDRVVHEPARLAILTVLEAAGDAEFRFLENVTGLTKGNLSSHAAKLEAAGYVEVGKSFRDRVPLTTYRITKAGRAALGEYRRRLTAGLGPPRGGRAGRDA